jgi:predicted TIM-barrel fold metal-dependent hydrolase
VVAVALEEAEMATLSPAANALGLGGLLADQVKQETEEQRRRRLLLEQLKQSTVIPAVPVGFGPLAGGRRI